MDTSLLSSVLGLVTTFATVGGGALLLWGAIGLGTSLKDHNGPGIQSGVWSIIGGGLIIAAAQLFNSIL